MLRHYLKNGCPTTEFYAAKPDGEDLLLVTGVSYNMMGSDVVACGLEVGDRFTDCESAFRKAAKLQ